VGVTLAPLGPTRRGFESHPLRHTLLISKALLAVLDFQYTNRYARLTRLSLQPWRHTAILAKLNTGTALCTIGLASFLLRLEFNAAV
jgi:hypothetical protein